MILLSAFTFFDYNEHLIASTVRSGVNSRSVFNSFECKFMCDFMLSNAENGSDTNYSAVRVAVETDASQIK